MATEVKLYRIAEDAYRGRKKLHGGKKSPTAFYFSDGPEGLRELAGWLETVARRMTIEDTRFYSLLHSARINFNQPAPASERGRGDMRGYDRR